LTRVVRAHAGDPLEVFDGRGRAWTTTVLTVGRGTALCAPAVPIPATPEPPVAVTLVMGVLKGDQMDAVVRDATVMGVTRIAPVVTDHVTVPARAWRDGAAHARWHRVSVAAARQCRRAVLPEILPVQPLTEALLASTLRLVCMEPAVAVNTSETTGLPLPPPAAAHVIVGPEGGWSPAECQWFTEHAAVPLRLGPRTLRAEATPMVALATLWTHWGW
jgi:16S rRNA (uracil1498-N3)-methyltransferase